MENELSLPREQKKLGEVFNLAADFEKLTKMFTRRHDHGGLALLKRLKTYVSRAERPSAATLNKLALLAGFQSWHDLDDALHGEGKDVMGDGC